MRMTIGLAVCLCLVGIAGAQSTGSTVAVKSGVKPAAKPTVKSVTPANQAAQRPLPIEARGITITTSKLVYVLLRP